MAYAPDTRERLLDAAIDLMYARSYAGVGVQELCEHAGVKKGSFYHFFPSKCDLTIAALDRQAETFQQTVLGPAFAKTLAPLTRIETLFDLLYRKTREMKKKSGRVLGCALGNLASELSTQEEPIRRKVSSIFNSMMQVVQRTLDDAVADGEIATQDTRATAEAIVAYMEGVMLLAKTRNDPEIIHHLGRAYLRGLAGEVSHRREPTGTKV